MVGILASLVIKSIAMLVATLNSIATLKPMTAEISPEKREQLAEAGRLKQLYDAMTPSISQEEFGHLYDVGSQGMVWQYLNGRRPLNLRAAIGFARGLRQPLEAVSPTLAALVRTAIGLCGPAGHAADTRSVEEKQLTGSASRAVEVLTQRALEGWPDDYFEALVKVLSMPTLVNSAIIDSSTVSASAQTPVEGRLRKDADDLIEAATRDLTERGETGRAAKANGTRKTKRS